MRVAIAHDRKVERRMVRIGKQVVMVQAEEMAGLMNEVYDPRDPTAGTNYRGSAGHVALPAPLVDSYNVVKRTSILARWGEKQVEKQ